MQPDDLTPQPRQSHEPKPAETPAHSPQPLDHTQPGVVYSDVQSAAPQPSVVAQQPVEHTPPPPPPVNPGIVSDETGDYASNPFKAVSLGLGQALSVNPVTSLSIVGLGVLSAVAALVIFVGLGAILSLGSAFGILAMVLAIISVALILIKLTAASIVVHLHSIAGESITGRQAFGKLSTKHFGKFLLLCLLTFLGVLIGLILLVVPGFILLSRWSLAPFALYGEGLGPVAALKRSWKLTKKHNWEMLGATFAQVLVIGTSGGLLGTIGNQAAYANRYKQLTAAEAASRATGKLHKANILVVVLTSLGIAGYILVAVLLAHSASQTQSSFDFSGSTTGNGTNSYCYYPDISTGSLKQKCTSKSTCQATSACSELYFPDTSGSNSLTQ